MITDTNFTTNKNIWKFNSFIFLIISYLLILWDSIYFYINSFNSYEKIFIVIINIILIMLILYYYKSYKTIKVNTITYKYNVDEMILEILKSITFLFKKQTKKTWRR